MNPILLLLAVAVVCTPACPQHEECYRMAINREKLYGTGMSEAHAKDVLDLIDKNTTDAATADAAADAAPIDASIGKQDRVVTLESTVLGGAHTAYGYIPGGYELVSASLDGGSGTMGASACVLTVGGTEVFNKAGGGADPDLSDLSSVTGAGPAVVSLTNDGGGGQFFLHLVYAPQ